MSNQKVPGPDNLTSECYKRYNIEIRPILLKFYQFTFSFKCSFIERHTVLLPKSKDASCLRLVMVYKPISRCNVDYELYAKMLTNGLKFVITSLVREQQTCGIGGSSIQTNVHIARSVLETSNQINDYVAMIQMDLQKAFDRVKRCPFHGFNSRRCG